MLKENQLNVRRPQHGFTVIFMKINSCWQVYWSKAYAIQKCIYCINDIMAEGVITDIVHTQYGC